MTRAEWEKLREERPDLDLVAWDILIRKKRFQQNRMDQRSVKTLVAWITALTLEHGPENWSCWMQNRYYTGFQPHFPGYKAQS